MSGFLDLTKHSSRVATFDLESDGLLPDASQIWCAVLRYHDGTRVSFSSNPDLIRGVPLSHLPSYLDKLVTIIGHNIIDYDLPLLRKLMGYEFKGQVFDTLVISRLQNPLRLPPKGMTTSPHSVEAWGRRFGRYKVEIDDWSEFTPDKLHRCEEDTEIQYLIWEYLEDERNKCGYRWDLGIYTTCKLFRHLQRQEERGWTFDQTAATASVSLLNRWQSKIDTAIAQKLPLVVEPLEARSRGVYNWVKRPFLKSGAYSGPVVKHFGSGCDSGFISGPFSRIQIRPLDLDSASEVKDFLLDLGWEPAEWNYDSEGNRTSPKLSKTDPFEGMQGSLGKLLTRRMQIKQRRGIIEGLMKLVREDGRIATRHTGLTPTARLKHSGVVNIPSTDTRTFFARHMRRLFIASPGMVMIGVDSKGNQMRQLAARMGDKEFSEAVLRGNSKDKTDMHSLNQKRSGVATRTEAKNFFYGFIFGAGDAKIGKIIGKNRDAGKALKENYLAEMPALNGLIQDLGRQFRSTAQKRWNPRFNRPEAINGTITGVDGRPIFVDSEHKALNYQLQSDEAIQMAVAYCWFHSQVEKMGLKYGEDWGMLIWYHDEYQLECLPQHVDQLKDLAEESIALAGRFLKIPIEHEGEAKVGYNWSETH